MSDPEKALLDFGWMIHDNMTVMQAAWIEWKHGGGAEIAMEWIENSLDGPGLIPDDAIVDAQEFFDANVSHAVRDKADRSSMTADFDTITEEGAA